MQGLIVVFALSLLAPIGGTHTNPASAATATLRPQLSNPIKHIIIIDEENHSFDEVLGRFCADIAAGLVSRQPCDGATQGTLSDGTVIPLAVSPDIVPSIDHKIDSQAIAINGGAMNGFDLIKGCRVGDGYECYTQFQPAQIPNLATLAQAFALSDRTFEFASTPSWASHVAITAATMDGYRGDNPEPGKFAKPEPGWGCDSNRDAPWWNGKRFVWVPACIPNQNGDGPYRQSPVPHVPTIFDRLDSAGLKWKIYGGEGHNTAKSAGYLWTLCPYFYDCLSTSQWDRLVPARHVITDAQKGRLPSFSMVTPTEQLSQHNNFSMAVGDNWIGQILSAVQTGPDWATTAVFITYDDCGCFYDHVNPLAFDPNWGIRVPFVIVSPYARAGYTDSTPATLVSVLTFTEHTFGLAPLSGADGSGYDYMSSFNFGQAPTVAVPMTHTRIPRAEREWIREHPGNENDVT
jgi:phospholipase C